MNRRQSIAQQILAESISYDYRIPKKLEEVFFDFYLWELLYSFSKGRGFGADSSTMDLESIAETAYTELVNYLYPRVLFAALYGVSLEFCDLLNKSKFSGFDDNPGFDDDDEDDMGYNDDSDYREIPYMHSVDTDMVASFRGELGELETSAIKVKTLTSAIKSELRMDLYEFLSSSALVFQDKKKEIGWFPAFGGYQWASGAKETLNLVHLGSKSVQEKGVGIDIMLSLQHNTGTFLSKGAFFKGMKKQWQDIKTKSPTPAKWTSRSSVPQYILGRYQKALGLKLL